MSQKDFAETYNEVEQLRGLLCAFEVVFPETGVRIRPCVAKIDMVLNSPNDQTIYYLVEDLQNLLVYFGEIEAIDKEMVKSTRDSKDLIMRLLGPIDGYTQ